MNENNELYFLLDQNIIVVLGRKKSLDKNMQKFNIILVIPLSQKKIV